MVTMQAQGGLSRIALLAIKAVVPLSWALESDLRQTLPQTSSKASAMDPLAVVTPVENQATAATDVSTTPALAFRLAMTWSGGTS